MLFSVPEGQTMVESRLVSGREQSDQAVILLPNHYKAKLEKQQFVHPVTPKCISKHSSFWTVTQ